MITINQRFYNFLITVVVYFTELECIEALAEHVVCLKRSNIHPHSGVLSHYFC